VPEPEPLHFDVTVRNPLPVASTLRLRLSGPPEWQSSTAELAAGPREEATARMSVTPTAPCRRQAVAVELHVGERPFGQILEALVTVGGASF
jgi:hypothetical protein